MSFRGSVAIVGCFAAALVGNAQQSVPTPTGSVDELAGLWKAQRWFGPVARGPLVIRRSGSS